MTDELRERLILDVCAFIGHMPSRDNAQAAAIVDQMFGHLSAQGLVIEKEGEKDEVYHERNYVVALLARLFPSGIKNTDIEGWDSEWHGCVYIDLPTGQVSWHFHDTERYMFRDLPPYHGEWDGHTSLQKYLRVTRMLKAAEGKSDEVSDL